MRPSTSSRRTAACSAALHQFVDLAFGHSTGLIEARLHELLVDVLEHNRNSRHGDRLGDLAAHRPGAHHGGLEHEHVLAPLLAWVAAA